MGKRAREEELAGEEVEGKGKGQEQGQGQGRIHRNDVELIKESCKLLLDGVQSSIEQGLF